MNQDLSQLQPAPGSVKQRKRVGRGSGSGWGKTAARGVKGQDSRSGGGVPAGFEGGQMPMQRRLPKRGFRPRDRQEWTIINLKQLQEFQAQSEVDPQSLLSAGVISRISGGVKILGDGELSQPLTVRAHKFSRKAEEKIKAAGGQVEVI